MKRGQDILKRRQQKKHLKAKRTSHANLSACLTEEHL